MLEQGRRAWPGATGTGPFCRSGVGDDLDPVAVRVLDEGQVLHAAVGQALLEEGVVDPRDGRILNANLADYMIPTNADIPEIRTISVGVPEMCSSPRTSRNASSIDSPSTSGVVSSNTW